MLSVPLCLASLNLQTETGRQALQTFILMVKLLKKYVVLRLLNEILTKIFSQELMKLCYKCAD